MAVEEVVRGQWSVDGEEGPAISLGSDLRAAIPYLDQWLGLWCMEPDRFRALADRAARLDIHAHLVAVRNEAPAPKTASAGGDYPIASGGVALISVSGPLMKHVSSMSRGSSTVLARRRIRQAAADEMVCAILLVVDSPGGTVAGTQDLAADVARAAAQKPLVAYIEDLGASAAYWIASQATKVYANPTALVGSIGTYGVVYDWSQAAEQDGVKVHVIRAGAYKGMAEAGTAVTDAQLAEFQRIVDELNAHFLAGVGAGRRMKPDQVAALADGRVHLAAPAATLGLIDGVKTFDQVLRELTQTSTSKPRRSKAMTTEATPMETTQPAAPSAATYPQLKSALAGADAAFLCAQMEAAATLDQARAAWMGEQQRRIEAADKRAEEAETKAKAAATIGVKPVETKGGADDDAGGDDAQAEWNQAIEAKIKAGLPRPRAVAAVVRERPQLREALVAQANEGRRA
jgi:signal peptide peptidase SppA